MGLGLCLQQRFAVHYNRSVCKFSTNEYNFFPHLLGRNGIRIFGIFLSFPASSDNMARLWTVETGEVKREYSGHQKAVVSLAFRDDTSE